MDVYELKADLDRAGLLDPVDEEAFDWLREHDGRPFGSGWRPLPVVGVVDSDYPEPPSLDAAPRSVYLAVSPRAVDALADWWGGSRRSCRWTLTRPATICCIRPGW